MSRENISVWAAAEMEVPGLRSWLVFCGCGRDWFTSGPWGHVELMSSL